MFKKKDYVFLQGGLGNQLYVLNYADFLKRNGRKVVKIITLPEKKGDTKDKSKRLIMSDIPLNLGIDVINFWHRYFYSMILRVPRLPFYNEIWSKFIKVNVEPIEEWAVFNENIEKQVLFNFHVGYYQSINYLSKDFVKKISGVVKKLAPKNEKYKIKNEDIAVHIRRGDFLKGKNGEVYSYIDSDYYSQALELVSKKQCLNKVYVFSDDFGAISSEIKTISEKYDVVLVEGQSVLEDVNLLQKFNCFVVGNSTFVWWGALLSQAETVVAPKKPWKIKIKKEITPYPKNWILLEN